MNVEQIEKILNDSTGNPSSGAVAEWIPVMAAAVAAALAPATEDRVLRAAEKR
jgi:hypothetical protein